jgi:hypothetical protein
MMNFQGFSGVKLFLGRMQTVPAFVLMVTTFGCQVCAAASAVTVPAQSGQQSKVARSIGVIKAISGNSLTVAPESGPDITAVVQPNARVLRLNPGDKDLKNAATIQLQDLHVGDTVRVRGFASADGKSIDTLEVLVITRSAVDAIRDQIRQDWQKHGIGGLVEAVDASTGTITISVTGFSGKKSIAVHTSAKTTFRRYAPDSVKFEDARPSSLAAIHSGDQLRARGERSADGAELKAEEVVTGNFRNIAGLVNSVDAISGVLTVQDLLSKKPVQVTISSDSQLHQLPPEMAQRIAVRLKAAMSGAMPAGMPGGSMASASGQNAKPASDTPNGAGQGRGPGMGNGPGSGMRPGGAPDFQQFLNHLPAVALADLHKGDAVMIVSTEGTPSHASTIITLLRGVEPILQAAPNASQAMMLTPWSLGGAPGGDAGNQ